MNDVMKYVIDPCVYELVGGLEHVFFHIIIGNVVIPTDFHSIIFQRGRSTTNQLTYVNFLQKSWKWPFSEGISH